MLTDRLNYVLAIAEERNITAAAHKLYVSQPTLTVYLNRLESELGVKLFDRSRTPITLTPAGVYYIEEMKKIEESEQKMRSSIRLVADPSRTLLVGIGQVRGSNWLPQILPDFCSIHPDVNVQILQAVESRQGGMLKMENSILPSDTCLRPYKILKSMNLTQSQFAYAHIKNSV